MTGTAHSCPRLCSFLTNRNRTLHLIGLGLNVWLFGGLNHGGDGTLLPTPRFVSHETKPLTISHWFGRERVYGSCPTNRNRTLRHISLGVNVCMVGETQTMARVCPHPRLGFTQEPKPHTAPNQIGCERVYGS